MDLIKDMLNKASGLLSEGKTIVEWFDPKSYLHRGAFRIYCKTGSWPEGVIPENVTLTPDWEEELSKKIEDSGQAIEGRVPDKDDTDAKLIQKLTEAGIKENEVRDIWVVIRPQSNKATMDDVIAKSSPHRLMIMAKGGLKPEDLVGVYDNEVEARKKGSALLSAGVGATSESKINEGKEIPSNLKAELRNFYKRIPQMSTKQVESGSSKLLKAFKAAGFTKKEFEQATSAYIDKHSKNESKVNEGPLDTEAPEAEAGAGPKDPGFKSKKEPAPGEKEEEAPVGDLDVDDEHEAVEADFDKIYLGQDDTNHYYVIAKKDEEGSTEDLLVTDQEGKELFSAKENSVDIHDVGKFILAAINSDKVKIRELEREVVIQYLVPEKEEELGAGEEEDEEGEGSEGEEATPKAENEPPETENPDQERPMESRKVVTEKKVTETVTMKDGKGNTFSLQIVDEGGKDVVVQINNREFRFKPDFVELYEMDGGELTEKGLQDMATELISHLREDEYAEVVGSGVQEDLDPSVTKKVGEDTLLQRAQQLRAKKDRTPDDDATLRQLEDELKNRGQGATEGKVPDKDDSDSKIVQKLEEQYLDESEEFQSCASHGGRVRTVSGPDKEHGLKAGEYVHYCYLGDKSFRGEVKTKKNESKVDEMEKDGLAKKAGKKPEDFDKVQLEAGTKVEMEHTDNPSKARQIAMDHLTEDPQYYVKLKKVEGRMNEREHSDLALQADTKEVFKVDFVLDSGEKRSTKVMAVDKFDAERMLKRQKGVTSVTSVVPIAGAKESKVNEDAGAQEYHKKLWEFLDHPWQEDNEIKLVNMIGQYRGDFKVNPPVPIQDYLKRLVNENGIMDRQGFSDEFMNALQDLMGTRPNEPAKEGEPPVESKIEESTKYTKNQLQAMSIEELTEIYNQNIPIDPSVLNRENQRIKRFRTKEEALSRVDNLLYKLGKMVESKKNESKKDESRKVKESFSFTPENLLVAACNQEHGWAVADQLKHIMDEGDTEDLNPNAVQLIKEFLEDAANETEGEMQSMAQELLDRLPGSEEHSEGEEEPPEPEMAESVDIARKLLGLKEKAKEDEPVKVGDLVQIVDANTYRVEVEEATVKAIDEKKGVEITGSTIPVSQKWYSKPYWFVSKL